MLNKIGLIGLGRLLAISLVVYACGLASTPAEAEYIKRVIVYSGEDRGKSLTMDYSNTTHGWPGMMFL